MGGGIYDLRDAYRSSAASVPTQAVISSYKAGLGAGGAIDFQISYVFTIKGQGYHGTDIVRTPPASNHVTVLYDPDNPNQNMIKEPSRITGWFLLGLGILVIVVFSRARTLWQRKDIKRANDTVNVASSGHNMRTEEEIQKDVRVFAEKYPLRGGLYFLDPKRAEDMHKMRRWQAREAMQPVEPAHSGPIEKEWGYCRNHPFVKTNWRCMDCGREFCEECVTPLHHLMSHLNRFAVCPKCKGRCIDFQHIERVACEKRDEAKPVKVANMLGIFGLSVVAVSIILLFMIKTSHREFHAISRIAYGIAVITCLFGWIISSIGPKRNHVYLELLISFGIIVGLLVWLYLKYYLS